MIILTGSHPTPALALEAKLKSKGRKVKHLNVSTPKFNRHQPIRSTLSLVKLPISIIKAYQKLLKLNPSVVVSFGGYQALPICLAAKLLHLPLIIHEQTFNLGLTSKLTSFLADKIAVSWPESLKHFPSNKTILTGNPVRQEIFQINRKPASHKTIYITGGHFGSKAINEAIEPILPQLLKRFTIYHQFGLNQSTKPPLIKDPNYNLQTWFDLSDLKKIYSITNLVIGRSGINTITELAYLKIPAVLIPLTTAQKNEQQTNADFLKSLGLGLILSQDKLNSQSLLQAINQGLTTLPQKAASPFDYKLITSATDKLYQLVINLEDENKKN